MLLKVWSREVLELCLNIPFQNPLIFAICNFKFCKVVDYTLKLFWFRKWYDHVLSRIYKMVTFFFSVIAFDKLTVWLFKCYWPAVWWIHLMLGFSRSVSVWKNFQWKNDPMFYRFSQINWWAKFTKKLHFGGHIGVTMHNEWICKISLNTDAANCFDVL